MATATGTIKAPRGYRWVRLKGARHARRHLAVDGRRRPLCGSHQVGGRWIPTGDTAIPVCANCLTVHAAHS